ncbi:type II toxin-antitoxin system VapC family toxin [uncultured Erythrobacter sp.]|uniref:type II toxin-antitoxin system VapC family toxin n=1 Tax=uncultured Erythrobacter sp. TaxID=263913 RepID=UPI002657E270|nr:type II toxin-antitoxin system VapC family toxin [uncultured Erythrobacter sp.]
MIVIDTSAIIAILHREPESDELGAALYAAQRRVIGAPTLFEMRQVMGGRHGRAGTEVADDFLEDAGIETLDWTAHMADLATDAFLRFGKGQGHPAQLNFGDCMAYAVAKALNAPLLFKGDDFVRTDIPSALAQ